jgi:hypothetical protein
MLILDLSMLPEDWKELSIPQRILFCIVKLPCQCIVKLSVPTVDEESWDPLLAAISPVFASFVIYVTFNCTPSSSFNRDS